MRIATFLLTVFFLAAPAQAQADREAEFRLTVYGMVCNQCAYGVEQTLQHTDGVRDAIVDLKRHSVVVRADPSPPPAPETLARKVLDQRVSLKAIEATFFGRVARGPDGWTLVAGPRRFPIDEADRIALTSFEGVSVVVTGTFRGVPGVDGASGVLRFGLRSIRKVEALG